MEMVLSSRLLFSFYENKCTWSQCLFFVLHLLSLKKKDGDLTLAMARAKDLEAQFNKSEANLATALSENGNLAAEVADLKAQLAKVSVPFTVSLSRHWL